MKIGIVCYASLGGSGVVATELAHALGEEDFGRLLSEAIAVAIGRTTARELTTRGRSATVAEAATLRSLALTTFRLLQTRP